jgi:hypothetical protein
MAGNYFRQNRNANTEIFRRFLPDTLTGNGSCTTRFKYQNLSIILYSVFSYHSLKSANYPSDDVLEDPHT